MARTNVVIDDKLIRRVMRTYGFRTKRETIDYALRRLVSPYTQKDMLDMRGTGWEGDLQEMRSTRFPEWSE
jgi:Arc/MetJ family transcription regulator